MPPFRYPNYPVLSSHASNVEIARALNEIRDYFARVRALPAASPLSQEALEIILTHINNTNGNPHGTRHNATLQIQGGASNEYYHLDAAKLGEVEGIHGVGAGVLVKTAAGAYVVRQITGTDAEITVNNGDGVAGVPTISLPETIKAPRKIGGASHYTQFEEAGTGKKEGFLSFTGDARCWNDLQFDISSGRVGVANFPDWLAFTANTSEYGFDVNDYIDLKSNETYHGWDEGTDNKFHLHVTTRSANSSGADRFAQFTLWIAYADFDEVWAETSFTAELTIPDGTPALYHTKLPMGTLELLSNKIGTQIKGRIKRIAATGGTEYADHIFLTQVGDHQYNNSLGSRGEGTK